jgi:hypothetical protein
MPKPEGEARNKMQLVINVLNMEISMGQYEFNRIVKANAANIKRNTYIPI